MPGKKKREKLPRSAIDDIGWLNNRHSTQLKLSSFRLQGKERNSTTATEAKLSINYAGIGLDCYRNRKLLLNEQCHKILDSTGR